MVSQAKKLQIQEELRKILNPQQYEAVVETDGALLILAGAGSGKTRVITHKIQYLVNIGIPASSILAVTFTNKAAREMKERVAKLVGKGKKGITITTFHSLGLQILEREITHLGYRGKFSIYDDSDCQKLLKEIIHELKLPEDEYDLKELLFKIGLIKIKMHTASGIEDPNLPRIYEMYQKNLMAYNAVDFNDLIKLPIILFEEHPEILEKYRNRWRYILVDEYQDTSAMQYRLMKMLAYKHRNISVVGDDDQSIYSWRGANSSNISMFEQDFYPIKEIKLEQNYRCTGNILKAANSIICRNTDRKAKKLWTSGSPGNLIQWYEATDPEEEAEFVMTYINRLHLEGYKYSDFGILFRMNNQSQPIEELLRTNNIPYKVIGATKFFERPEIKDILSYMRFIANMEDEVSLTRIINTPKRGIGNATITAIMQHAKETNSSMYCSIRDFVRLGVLGPKTTPYLEDFYNLIEKYREQIFKPRNIARTVSNLVDEIDYKGKLLLEVKDPKSVQYKMRNISQLYQSISNYEKNPDNMDPNIYEYLQRVSLSTRDDDNDGDEISLLSIHSAKGLEYKVVFVIGVEDGLIPHDKTMEETGTDQEERRLFYVAVTRARERLFLSYPKERTKFKETSQRNPSPFMNEIPEDVIETLDIEKDLGKKDTLAMLLDKWNLQEEKS
ncbi:MAG: UvrD-helicase domain-containing protein [Spirochaetales bacterium]|nr:UvrD-helicase domain-containing protein [Spirochaetales bacterium]